MAKLTGADDGAIYAAAEQFVDRCWRHDDSLFTPAVPVWTTANLDELDRRFVQAPDLSNRRFLDKLRDQLEAATPGAVQLMAELLYGHLLLVASISGPSKRSTITTVLGWMPEPPTIPADLDRALDGGIINPGQFYLARRDLQLTYLIRAALAWRTLEPSVRSDLLADPWAFREWAFGIEGERASSGQRNVLLHLVHPDTFDSLASDVHKDRIAASYAELVVTADGNVDQKLAEIRAAMTPERGEGFDWYSPDLRRRWRGEDDTTLSEEMRERRVRRYAEMRGTWEADPDRVARYAETFGTEAAGGAAVAAAIERFGANLDVRVFVDALIEVPSIRDRLPVRQFLVRLAERAGGDRALAERLVEIVRLPATDGAASDQIHRLRRMVQQLGAAKPFSVGASGLVLSTIWTTLDPVLLPIYYADAQLAADALGWVGSGDDVHAEYWQLIRELDPEEPRRAVQVLAWAAHDFCGLPSDLAELCRANAVAGKAFIANGKQYVSEEEERLARERAEALVGESKLFQRSLKRELSELLGANKAASVRPTYGTGLAYRHEVYVKLDVRGTDPAVDFRVWFTVDGVAVGLWPKWASNDAIGRVRDRVVPRRPEGLDVLRYANTDEAIRLEPTGGTSPDGAFLIGRLFGPVEAAGQEFLAEVRAIASAVEPLIAELRSSTADPVSDQASADDVLADPGGADLAEEIDHIQLAADDLLVDRVHLDEIVEMLDDKGQVILYGPPGTGKTFLATRLATALTGGDLERWQLVQFHPSSSYEDFFEGYRPAADGGGGGVRYELTPGPLARMAEMAAAAPARTHVLVIDEINRANIPKVFGELLYLLEYRDEPVRTLYRPDREFRLPPNLKIIGTMNTADRSIGLVDAAMRRRFRFVGFFPDTEPMEGLLGKWLEANGEPAWVADLVAAVNLELVEHLGRHLQLGPSFFMSRGLTRQKVAKIWKHSVEPFVEDQFFGDQARIDHFTWDEVWGRHKDAVRSADEHGDPPADEDG